MKYLSSSVKGSLETDKILANWATVSKFIYGEDANEAEIQELLQLEVLNKDRPMIVERLIIRLLSLIKDRVRAEIKSDIEVLREKRV